MSAAMLIDGLPGETVSALDRGLCYGDGVFETIRFVDGDAPLWSRHAGRLLESCERLGLPLPPTALMQDEARTLIGDRAHAVVRITVTRGEGERGYAPPLAPRPRRIVAVFDAPAVDPAVYRDGLRTRVCDLRLAEQPRLAGIKHLNRLEQVLARAEWCDPAVGEGLLRDAEGRLICATMANLFVVMDDRLVTPAVDRCGVAGVARAEVLAFAAPVQVGELRLKDLAQASEVFLTSSVRGILPVRVVGDASFVVGPVTRALQRHWRDLGFQLEQA